VEKDLAQDISPTLDAWATTFLRPNWPADAQKSAEMRTAYLTALNGKLLGRTYRLGAGRLFVGRADDCDIVLDDDGVSRRHALLLATPSPKVMLEDLGSTNGTLIDGHLASVCELQGGEHLQFGSDTVFKFEFRDSLEERYATYLYESSTQDRLTAVFNARYFREQLDLEYAWHHRHRAPLSLIFLDIDRFKEINDEHGHLIGDEVLKKVALACHAESRSEDVFARYGGEEFACLLRQTSANAAIVLANRMRAAVADRPFRVAINGKIHAVYVTISAGVATLGDDAMTPDTLLAEADRYLYAAKDAGRNRVHPALA
jgi:two-component system, cell cycle response regulator